ncbi:MAG: dipeptide/oligopeptide/nickel ABC transporter ATP-binding protein [Treponema sp.]|nr:dipeptide/oligopeptide/nickel ABC transporter ATP-binding protein [Treponema sp.]
MSEPKKIGEVFLAGKNLTRVFGHGDKKTIAVNNVDFEFRRGEIISIVGESGSGKTTLAKMILGLLNPTSGEIFYEGKPRDISSHARRRSYWQNIQAIFQDPFSAYNIFNRVDSVLMDCIRLQGGTKLSPEENFNKMSDACKFVNLKFEELTNKYPLELSGGQMQRLMIARIFMLNPRLLIADEPTSMIDACSRATILDMLLKLRDEINMTIVFITHDMGLAYYISDTVYIMEKGLIVERGSADEAILSPKSDYTKRLIGDVPKIYEPWDFSASAAETAPVTEKAVIGNGVIGNAG